MGIAAIVALIGSPAQARPEGSHAAFHRTGADNAGSQSKIRAYWTKARMRAAIPKNVHGRPSPDVAAGKPKVVKGQSVGFNLPRGQFTYSFGYPAARPYDGTTLDYCSSTTSNDTVGGSQDQRLACNMTGGSSGGPWFVAFDKTKGTGTQISINSFGYTGEKNAMYGPYFGSVIQSLYTSFSAS